MKFGFSDSNQVVTRYKFSIIGVFIAIMLAALLLASYRYYGELQSFENSEYRKLTERGESLNKHLAQAKSSAESIQRFASYMLSFPEQALQTLPNLKQDGEQYFLDIPRQDILEHRQKISVNITGEGILSELPETTEQELSMAYTLTSAFTSAQSANPAANWFYYISQQEFVSIYPWIGRQTWQYSPVLYNNNHINKISQSPYYTRALHWSAPYIGSSANSLYVAVGTGVYRQDQMVGAVVINIDLKYLHEELQMAEDDGYRYLLINEFDQLLLDKYHQVPALNKVTDWQSSLPSSFEHLTYNQLAEQTLSWQEHGYFFQQYQLNATGWRLVKFKQHDEFIQPIFERFMWLFILLFLGQFALLSVVYLVTRKTFIKPTQQFISHIAYSAQGDHGKVQPPSGWQHWFNIVGDIFSQNRSLMQQLKDQNSVLDMRVNEKTQALLEKSRQHQHDYAILRSVMNAIPDYLIFNDTQGKVIGCNSAFEQLVDLTEGQILGHNAGTFLNNELGKALIDSNEGLTAIKTNHGIFQVIETVDNTYEFFTSEFFDEQQILGSILIIRDVTKQYAVNAALEKAKEQAEYANQAKSQFLANMSHEIRTPINAIQGMHSLLVKTKLSNQQQQNLEHAQDASAALLHLVDELLDLSKIESGKMSIIKHQCRLDYIVNRAVKLNYSNIKHKSLDLIVNIAEDVPYAVLTDDMRLTQVLSNLLNNASKFTHQGSISLLVDTIATGEGDNLVRFVIRDTGIGIAKDKQQRLFEAFMQADESMTREYGGSGLGLSICQRIINLLGGKIKIESDINQGAEFSFVLPFKRGEDDRQYQLNNNVQVTSLAFELPDSFQNLLSHLNIPHRRYENLSEFDTSPDFGAQEETTRVLFIPLEQVTTELCQQIKECLCAPEQGRCVLAIIGQSEEKMANQAFQILDQFSLPYHVCEQPLYRYTLCQMLPNFTEPQALDSTVNNPVSIDSKTVVRDLSGIKVLLVEDNLVNQLVAKELLKSMSADVTVVDNGEKAIEWINKESFDVVLMDIQMPVMDGLTATKHIRNQPEFKTLPIIAMTAHARQEDKDNSYAAGMNMHVAKPVKGEVLLNSILSVIG